MIRSSPEKLPNKIQQPSIINILKKTRNWRDLSSSHKGYLPKNV